MPEEPVPADPVLNAFLNSIEGLFCPDGASSAAHRELDAAQVELGAHRQRAISAELLLDELKLLLAEQQGATGVGIEGFELLEQSLSLAEAHHGQSSEELGPAKPHDRIRDSAHLASMEHVLGARGHDAEERMQQMRRDLLPLLEQRIRARCEALAAFCEPGAGLSFGKTSTLPSLLRERRTRLADLRAAARHRETDLVLDLDQHIQVQLKTLSALHRMLHDGKLRRQAHVDVMAKDELIAYTQAQSLKLAKLRDQLRAETYTPEATRALFKVVPCKGSNASY
jgi:hypothetical protein